ncbi:MAG: MFS transporter [Chloroflexi bacterium]|nr:MFS transporter [Chloroflexota bacterium]
MPPHPSDNDQLQNPTVRTFGALGNPTFRRIWSFGAFYYTYRATELTVLSWFVLTLTGSEFQVALVGVSRIAPMFIFGLMAGGLSDRFSRPRLMAIGQSSNLIAATVMVALLVSGNAQPWHAYPIIFVTGTTWALDYASRRALLGDIFSGKALTNATALDAGLVTGSNMIGPLLGTVLIRIFDFQGAYIGVVMLTMAAFSLVVSIKAQPRPKSATAGRGSPVSQFRDAWILVRSNRVVLGAVLVTIVFNMMGWPFVQMVSVIARNQLGSGEVAFGLLLSGLGAGSLVGATFLAWSQPSSRGNVYTGGSALLMISAIGFAWSPWYLLALFWMFWAGVGLAGFAAMQPVIPLEAVPADQRGRAMGAIVLGIGFQAVGMAVMGVIAEMVGPREAIAILATLGIASLLVLRARFPALRDRPDPSIAAQRRENRANDRNAG